MFLQRRAIGLPLFGTDEALIAEQYRTLRSQVPTMYVAVFVNILFLAFASAPEPGSFAYILPIVISGLIAVRMITLLSKKVRRIPPTVAAMRASMRTTLVAAMVISVSISAWTVQLGHDDFASGAYIALFTALSTICCAACLSSLPPAAYIVVAIGTLPVSLSLLLSGHTVLASMGANIVVVSPLVVGMISRQHGQLRRLVESRSEIAAEKAKVSDLAYRDSLTGLANRRAFLDALDSAAAVRPDRALAIGMIDLDGFKVINDTYGHRTGDELLVETARRFERIDLGDALIARLGGDEFAVLMCDVDRVDDAHGRLTQLAGVFERPFFVGGQVFRLRASIGLAYDIPGAASTLSLVNRADLAMYEAKRAHSKAICLFEPGMEARTRRRIMVEQALAEPAESDLIVLHYQPIVDAATSRIVAFEALARWTHPTLGEITPNEFIPLAEQAGRTSAMSMHLLSLALQAASTWPAEIGLSFNLSAAEVNAPQLADRMLAMIAAHGCDPGRLSIEVTETALLGDFVAARTTLSALQRGGVRVLLDDFGAGYASIGYLREIRFDGVKIDGSLVIASTESPAAHDLLVGVLHLCRAIGAPVTAEMVETDAQHDLLRELGVEKLQGNFMSGALTADQALLACRTPSRTLPVDAPIVHRAKRPERRYA